MTITVLLFGPQAQLAGRREIAVQTAAANPTAAEILAALGETSPELRDSLRTSRLAVNHEFANDETVVTATDEVALIGMVSGG